ncbi:MAG TPA: thiol peroxidase [Bacteroidales bacterium]|nr:thiol peroxidase [Bacteroidales bacterium]
MSKITLKGNPINTIGTLPSAGNSAPEFNLTKTDLSDVSLENFKGKKVILNIFPSLDTSVCATSVRKFNAEAEKLNNTVVLCVSRDLPFAHNRFCTVEGLKNVIPLSELRDSDFGKDYGVTITDGPLAGLLSRAIVVIDENGKVVYNEQVPEIAQEPDYEKALKFLS